MVYEEIKKENKAKDFRWILQNKSEDNLYINDYLVNAKILEDLKVLVRATKEIYDDAWDFDFSIDKDSRVILRGLVIHFPLVTITNSRNLSHNIKDLFVKIVLFVNDTGLVISSIEGGRTTLSYAEYCSNYYHSHLTVNSIRDGFKELPCWSTFCLGTGSIHASKLLIQHEGFKEPLVLSFLLELMPLTYHESLEGTPYNYIEKIRSKVGFSRFESSTPHKLDLFLIVKNNGDTSKLNFYLEDQVIRVADDDSLESFIQSCITTSTQRSRYLCTWEDGIFFKYTTNMPNIVDIPKVNPFLFNGQTFEFIVEPPKDTELINWVIYPEYKNFIKTQIENNINEKIVRKSTDKRYLIASTNA